MSSSSRRQGLPNVPPPARSPARTTSAYTRFIPREELGSFAAWNPSALSGAAHPADRHAAPPPPPPPEQPPEPSADQWRAQVTAARQAGYQDGYRDGLVALEGFKQGFAAQMSAQLGKLVTSFDAELAALDERIAAAVAQTAVQLARQVLRSELALDPGHVARVASEAVEAVLLSARHITVQVHPTDHPLVAAGAEEALRARGARLVSNPAIERGGCRVESDVGSIDARIATRWAQAAQAMGSDAPWEAADTTAPDGVAP